MPTIEDGMRADIAAFLPHAIKTALESYQTFSEQQITDTDSTPTSQEFKSHHDACKVAIAHIELLIKLAKWADIPPDEVLKDIDDAKLKAVIESAHTELSEGGRSE